MKNKILLLAAPILLGLASCGGASSTSSTPASSSNPSSESASVVSVVESSEEEKEAAKLVGAYSSEANFLYMNMRPTYNYYFITYSFETLDLYDDGTYQFNLVSITFSGLNLPEEGSDGSANERENSVTRYYGTYTSTVDDLDEDTTHVSLSDPGRIVKFDDATVFYDTANWNDNMSRKAGATTTYNAETGQTETVDGEKSAADYLKENAFAAKTVDVNSEKAKLDFIALSVPEGGNANAKLGNYDDGLKMGISTSGTFLYMNMRPTYNYYFVTLSMSTLETYENGNYILNEYNSTFSGLVLPEEGSEGSANERENAHSSFYGTYTEQVDDLDEDIVHYSLSETNRVVIRQDAIIYYDTDNWTESMSKKAGETTTYNAETGQTETVEGEKSAADFLSEHKYGAMVVDGSPIYGSLDMYGLDE